MDNVHNSSAMICLLPTNTEWCKQEPAHLTIAFMGNVEDLKTSSFNEVAKDVASVAMLTNPIMAKVIGTDVFGDEEKVNVLNIESTQELISVNRLLDNWDVSEFPFNPHVTIGPVGSPIENVPMYLIFDRISVWWGDKPLTFWLKKF